MAARVSVVIPAFNAGPYLRPAVLSALAAGGAEALVVDDGSTDGSLASIADLPARVVRRENGGCGAARNTGVRAAAGEFVTFLDADDLLTPSGLAPRAEYLRAHPEAWGVGGLPASLIGQKGAKLADVFEPMKAKLEFPLTLTLARYRSGAFFPVQCCLYLYRRETFARVGPYTELPGALEDCDFHYRLLEKTSMPVLPVPVFERRMHASNLSMAGARPGDFSFKAKTLDEIRRVNDRHGLPTNDISPWELDYL